MMSSCEDNEGERNAIEAVALFFHHERFPQFTLYARSSSILYLLFCTPRLPQAFPSPGSHLTLVSLLLIDSDRFF
jgi:hypothetical protein